MIKFEDLDGAKVLASIRCEHINIIRSEIVVRVTEDYLVKNALSYGGCTKNILADLPAFRAKLRKILEPHLEDGAVRAQVLSWAHVYERK